MGTQVMKILQQSRTCLDWFTICRIQPFSQEKAGMLQSLNLEHQGSPQLPRADQRTAFPTSLTGTVDHDIVALIGLVFVENTHP